MNSKSWSDGYVTDVEYTYGFYRELSPVLLNYVCLLKGISPPRIDQSFNHIELGCGNGITANVLAAANPKGRFYAVDFNPVHILFGEELAGAAQINNVVFLEDSFATLADRELPAFDFITLHGVYSWITSENRQHIVNFIAKKLKPGGIVYISYNCLPGWAATVPIQRLMQEQTEGQSISRVESALAFVERLKATNAAYFKTNPIVEKRLEKLSSMDKRYVAHEYFNRNWDLFYCIDVARELSAAKLSYVGSASIVENFDRLMLTPEAQKFLTEIADPGLREMARDYVINQQFRRDIFIKGAARLSGVEQANGLRQLRFALTRAPSKVDLEIKTVLGNIKLKEDVYQPVVEALATGPSNLDKLMAHPRLNKPELGKLVEILAYLTAADQVWPVLMKPGDNAATNRLNQVILERAVRVDQLRVLASPVAATGFIASRLNLLFLLARQRKQADLAGFAWSIMGPQGQRLSKEGKTLQTEAENLEELRFQAQNFLDNILPIFQQFGIA